MTDDAPNASGEENRDHDVTESAETDANGSERAETEADESASTGTAVSYSDAEATDSTALGGDGAANPLSDLADELSPGSDDGEAQALFDEMDVATLDGERVWEQLEAKDEVPTGEIREREIRDIDKRRYCHQCEHFSDPPTVGCEHEGTSILELVDVQTVKVANCPVVLEEESIEDR